MRDDELDRIIDAGLSTYAEPPAGIEGRLLSQVSDSRPGAPASVVHLQKAPRDGFVLSHPLRGFGRSMDGAPRIRTKTNVHRPSSRAAWQVWAVGLSVAACVLIAVTVGVRVVEAPRVHHEQAANTEHAPVTNPTAKSIARSETPLRLAVKRRAHRNDEVRMRRLPKKELFPTPQPLSPEMQALVQFVARAPEAQRKQLIDAQAKLDAPITIAPLQIAPLKDSDEDEH